MTPVLCVHGIFGSPMEFGPLVSRLDAAGIPAEPMALHPADGRAALTDLSTQVAAHARSLARRHQVQKIDIVAFSMGALVTRHFIQRGEGRTCVRRFVSMCGPHKGSIHAVLLPTAGGRDMRPGSRFIRDLEADADPFGEVDTRVIWNPWDTVVVPPTSSRLPQAQWERRVRVPIHAWVPSWPKVIEATLDALTSPKPPPEGSNQA